MVARGRNGADNHIGFKKKEYYKFTSASERLDGRSRDIARFSEILNPNGSYRDPSHMQWARKRVSAQYLIREILIY